jgi:hypothetical protein
MQFHIVLFVVMSKPHYLFLYSCYSPTWIKCVVQPRVEKLKKLSRKSINYLVNYKTFLQIFHVNLCFILNYSSLLKIRLISAIYSFASCLLCFYLSDWIQKYRRWSFECFLLFWSLNTDTWQICLIGSLSSNARRRKKCIELTKQEAGTMNDCGGHPSIVFIYK